MARMASSDESAGVTGVHEVREILPGSTELAFEAMSELRPHLESVEEFVTRVDGLQRPEGYRLAGVFVPSLRPAVTVAGFRTGHNLADGHYLYVDDLVTAADHRSRGYARSVMDWLRTEAVSLGCDVLDLDSATRRHAAHRFYLGFGMDITAFHFGLKLSSENAD
jgi:GNAT superfamily N-acetyltransferase